MPIAADYPFLDVFWTMCIFFLWVLWFWLLFTVFADIFRRHDLSGWGKAGWVIFTILLPYLGVFIYLITQGRNMTERNVERVRSQQAQFDEYVRDDRDRRRPGGGDRQGQAAPGQRRDHAARVRGAQAEGAGHVVADDAPAPPEAGSNRLAVLLAMAMFVLVVDTSLMNVSISAVVRDLDTTVSGVQSAIALEALVSAAFILIGSKIGDLIGRKRAYVLGLLGYAFGALSMAFAQDLTAIIIFWAIIGGLGASLLLPAMQSLIHGNFEGAAQKKAYALVGAAAAIAAAVGPLLGGFITTFLSWRVAFLLEVVVIAVVLSGSRLVRDAPYTGPARDRPRRRGALGPRDGRHRARDPRVAGGRRGGRRAAGRSARSRWRRSPGGSCGASGRARPTLLDPDLFKAKGFRFGISRADAPADRARRDDDRAADLPADGARVQRAAGRPVARPAVADDVRRRAAGREARRAAPAEQHHPRRVRAAHVRDGRADPDRAPRRLGLVPRRAAGRSRAPGSACSCRS